WRSAPGCAEDVRIFDLDQSSLAWIVFTFWMSSKVVPGYSHRPAATRRSSSLGAGLSFYLFVCCALVGGFALEFYQGMQPTRYPNPGVSFRIQSEAEPSSAAAIPSVIESEMRTIGEAAPQPNMTKKIDHAATTVGVRRKPAAQPRAHDPTM